MNMRATGRQLQWMTVAGALVVAASAPAAAQDEDQDRERVRTTQYQEMPMSTTDTDTGYIDNAIVGTRFRIRFDSGLEIDKPDRAEFFYAKCGCFIGDDPNAPGPIGTPIDLDGNGTIEDSELLASPLIENSLDYDELRVDLEYALRPNLSVFAEIPYRQLDGEAIPGVSGFGDIRAGVKYAFVNRPDRVLTFQFRAYFPTGDAGDGLGTDHASAEPALLYFQRLSSRSTLTGEFRYWLPIDGSGSAGTGRSGDYAGDVIRWGLGYSYDFGHAPGMQITPIVELVGWTILDGLSVFSPDRTPNNAVVSKADDTIVNLKIGARWKLDRQNSIYFGFGKALTDEAWYDRIWRLEYRSTR